MAILKKKARVSGEIPTASMADIAFLLLVFFLVTTVFEEEKGLPIVLPEQGEEIEVSQKNVLHILIQPDGLVNIKRGESPQIQTVRYSEVSTIWRLEVSQNPNLIAAVKTAPTAPYRHMVNVLDELQSAGAQRIALQQLE
ncbi:MAG TPA: biopolymer transporter ExbD [Longimicrobiales bacterium]|nr:biopolymer transporter ExbD [Longimicrobiales bacterium]